MVDATDFATPESAVSAATTIKIYGKLRGATGVNFVSSGTGSLTNDIVHVGASATGIYTIALAKADLSDASAAWYDQYIITLSATGCARQTLVVDGGIDASTILAMSAMLSDAHSAAILAASNASEAQSQATLAASRALINQSRISDVQSYLVAMSDSLSDIGSDLRSYLVAMSDSLSDMHSDLRSFVGAGVPLDASNMSDLRSAIAAGPAATITASDISDIASAVWANTIGARVDSRVLLNLSRISDVYSLLSDTNSDLGSRLTVVQSMASDAHSAALVAQSQISDTYSMLSDALSGPMTASDLSDIASAVWAHTTGAATSSRVLLNLSRVSDIYSLLSDVASDVTVMSGVLSDTYSNLAAGVTVGASSISDVASAVWARAGADPTTVPAVTAGMGAKLDWLTALSRNKITQTATVQSLRNDADAADIASAAVSDDGTTFTRDEFA